MRTLSALLCLGCLCLLGCGDSQTTTKPQKTSSKPAAKKSAPKPAADAYPNIEEALAAFQKAVQEKDKEKRIHADAWLGMQGEKATAPVTALILDESQDLQFRIALFNVLRKLGASAKPGLLEALKSDNWRIRSYAASCLGQIQSSDQDIIDVLTALIDDPKEDIQVAAITSLARIGPPAEKAAADKLQTLFDKSGNGRLRSATKQALQAIRPRKRLVDE